VPAHPAPPAAPAIPQVARFAAAQARPCAPIRAYTLAARPQTVDLGGVTVPTWTYGTGTVPGPLLRGTTGDQLRVALANQLPATNADGAPTGTSVHWHGLAIRNDMDGVPDVTQPVITAGTTAVYDFTLPRPGTYWYHSHDGVQRDRGLIGPLIIDDPAEPGRYDTEFTVVLDDWIDGVNGTTPAGVLADLHRTGMRMDMGGGGPTSAVGGDGGDVDYPYYLVNGRIPDAPTVFTARPGQRARVRVINAAADTAFRVALGGHRLTVTHADAYPVVPTAVDTVLLGSGERYDLLVDLGDGVFPLVATAEGKTGGARALIRTSPTASAPPAGLVPAELGGRLLGLRRSARRPRRGAPLPGPGPQPSAGAHRRHGPLRVDDQRADLRPAPTPTGAGRGAGAPGIRQPDDDVSPDAPVRAHLRPARPRRTDGRSTQQLDRAHRPASRQPGGRWVASRYQTMIRMERPTATMVRSQDAVAVTAFPQVVSVT